MQNKPIIGEKISVVVKNNVSSPIFFFKPQQEIYSGIVVASSNFDLPDTFSMTSGLPDYKKFPIRTIRMRDVIDLKYENNISEHTEHISENINKTIRVKSSSGKDEYIVSKIDGRYSCTCSGYTFRKSCKHLKLLEE
jgi:hypothetical protein